MCSEDTHEGFVLVLYAFRLLLVHSRELDSLRGARRGLVHEEPGKEFNGKQPKPLTAHVCAEASVTGKLGSLRSVFGDDPQTDLNVTDQGTLKSRYEVRG